MKLSKKKKGSTLATVLILATALMIIGSQIATSVIQTRKTNERYNKVDDLELLAESGAEVAKNYLINKINSLKSSGITNLNNIKESDYTLPSSYLDEVIDKSDDFSLVVRIEKSSGFSETSGKFNIISEATWGEKNITKKAKEIVSVTIGNNVVDDTISDVITSEGGFLTQLFYNVNHMGAVSDSSGSWSNRNNTFKIALSQAKIVSATVSGSYYDYTGNDNDDIFTNITTNTIFTNHSEKVWNYKEAKKVWGYFKAPETGYYRFRIQSDDGVAFVFNNKVLINNFNPKYYNPNDYANENIKLEAGKFYPIYIEYFNWGGDARLILEYNTNKRDENLDKSSYSYSIIQAQYFYPSRTSTPPIYNFN